MKRLGVNIDHVATLRQARGTSYPDPCEAARCAIRAGADQITVHLREDRRHIQDADLERFANGFDAPLNLEMAAIEEITTIACRVRPATATIVPERRKEITTEGGLSVIDNATLPACIARLRDAGIAVSLFVDPDIEEIRASRKVGAETIELHTGAYCEAVGTDAADHELARLKEAAATAAGVGLRVAAGHGLNYDNTRRVVESLPEVFEYNIGHAIVARAVFIGIEAAVAEMKQLMA